MGKKFEVPLCELCERRIDSVFQELKTVDLENLSAKKSCNFYRKGESVFLEGNRPSGLFCIFKGKVKVFKLGEEGRDQIVRFAKPSDILGYRAMVSGDTYSASAAAIEDTICCFIPASTVFELIEENPSIALKMMQIFSQDLKRAETRLTEITQKPVRERLAEAILMLKETFGINEDGVIDVSLTRQEFANIIGTTTETAIRFLSDFRKEKLLDLDGRKIKVLKPRELTRIANIYD